MAADKMEQLLDFPRAVCLLSTYNLLVDVALLGVVGTFIFSSSRESFHL